MLEFWDVQRNGDKVVVAPYKDYFRSLEEQIQLRRVSSLGSTAERL